MDEIDLIIAWKTAEFLAERLADIAILNGLDIDPLFILNTARTEVTQKL